MHSSTSAGAKFRGSFPLYLSEPTEGNFLK